MGIFNFLKNLFMKKPKEEVKEEIVLPQETSVEVKETTEQPKQEEKQKEKICPRCGAPNNEAAMKCWLCKTEI